MPTAGASRRDESIHVSRTRRPLRETCVKCPVYEHPQNTDESGYTTGSVQFRVLIVTL